MDISNINSNTAKTVVKKTLMYNPNLGNAQGLEFEECVSLAEALDTISKEKELQCGISGDKDTVAKILSDVNDCSNVLPKIKKLINSGSSAIVFETEDGDVLKLTRENHFPKNRKQEAFDVPIYSSGKIGNTHYYIEEQLMQHDLSTEFVSMVIDMIKKMGYKPTDIGEWDIHQIGLSSKGKLYLLDPECAKPKNIFDIFCEKFLKLFSK